MRGGPLSERGRGRGRPNFYQRSGAFDGPDEVNDLVREPYRKGYDRSSSLSEDGPREKSFERTLKGDLGDESLRSRKDSRSLDNWRSSSRSDDKGNWRSGRNEDGPVSRDRHDSWRKDDKDSEEDLRNGSSLRRGYGNHYGDERNQWRGLSESDRSDYKRDDTDTNEDGSKNNMSRRNYGNNYGDERVAWRGSGRGNDDYRNSIKDHDFWRKEDRDMDDDCNSRNGMGPRRDYYNRRRSWWDDDDNGHNNLPEWSLEDSSNGEAKLGTFDASGAFREGSVDDDYKEVLNIAREKQKNSEKRENSSDKETEENNHSVQRNESDLNNELSDVSSRQRQLHNEDKSFSIIRKGIYDNKMDIPVPSSSISHSHQHELNSAMNHTRSHRRLLNDSDDGFSHIQKAAENMVAQWTAEDDGDDKRSKFNDKLNFSDNSALKGTLNDTQSSDMNMVSGFTNSRIMMSKPLNNANICQSGDKHHMLTSNLTNSQFAQILRLNSSQTNAKPLYEDDGLSHLEKAAENMVNQFTADDDRDDRLLKEISIKNKILVVPPYHEDAYKWFYRDPEGAIQGPFLPVDMYEWFASGYFTSNLLVKRGCDEQFLSLGELMKACGGMPFFVDQPPQGVNLQQQQSHNVPSLNSVFTTPNSIFS